MLKSVRLFVAVAAAACVVRAGTVWAQSSSSGTNSGALRFTGGLDAPTAYVFRGILQESEPKITLWPYGDIGIALSSGDGALKSVAVNFGVWNSLQTGNSGTSGISHHGHYEEDFYSTLNLGLSGGIGLGLSYMALTSPNQVWETIKEVQVKITKTSTLNPYGFLAFELTKAGQADAGTKKEIGRAHV